MNYDFIKGYMNAPFKHDCYGPEAFDCYGLVWHINKHHNAREFPRFDDMRAQTSRINATIQGQVSTEDWEEKQQPTDFDLVVMRRAGEAYHVGVWFAVDGGRVLHSTPQGVLCNDLGALRRMGFQHITYYHYANN